VRGQHHAPAAPYPWERPGTHPTKLYTPENKTTNKLEMKTGDFMEGNSVLHQELA